MLFISHSSKDKDAALTLRNKILARGYVDKQIFLDSNADSGIGAGSLWEQQLYSHLRRCVALIAVCSENFDKSAWCPAEVVYAKSHGKPIFPVFIQNCGIRVPLGDHQAVFVHQEGDAAYERLFKALEAAKLGPTDFFVWEGDCPYPGLPAFDEKLAGVYFGREEEVDSLKSQLAGMRERGEPRFLMITGGSGSGKSSLLKAGLLPRLRHQAARKDWIVLPVLRFGRSANEQRSIFDQLAVNVATTFPKGSPRHDDWQFIRGQLDPAGSCSAFIATLQDLAIALDRPDATVLIPIDQFEELLAPSAGTAATDFIRFLTALCASRNGSLLGIGTMRSDYVDVYGNHADTLKGKCLLPFILGPFPKERIGDVILKPAECAGVEITPELLAKLKSDAPSEECLPLLSFTLEKLYRIYATDKKLELPEYHQLGGMEGSIQKCVERVQKEIPFTPERTAGLRRSFVKHLVQINDKGLPVRETARWDEVDEAAKPILEAFIDEYLLVRSRYQDKQNPNKKWITVEVAHEALFSAWKDLEGWIAKSVDVIRWRQAIRRDRRENGSNWKGLTSTQLGTARNWPETRRDELEADEVKWIEEGIRRQRRRLGAVLAAVLMIAASAGVAWWKTSEASGLRLQVVQQEVVVLSAKNAETKRQEAQQEADRRGRRNLSQKLAFESQALVKRTPQRAALMAAEAIRPTAGDGDEIVPEAHAAANRALAVLSGRGHTCHMSQEIVSAIFDRSDNLVAVTNGGDVEIHDLTRPASRSLVHSIDNVYGDLVGFDGTGRKLLIQVRIHGSKHPIGIWEIGGAGAYPDKMNYLSGGKRFGSVAVSHDHKRLAAGDEDGIELYDLEDLGDQRVRKLVIREKGDISPLEFSGDDRFLLAGSRSGWVHVWDLKAGDPGLKELQPSACFRALHQSNDAESLPIRLVKISSDGTALATVAGDIRRDGEDVDVPKVQIWDLAKPGLECCVLENDAPIAALDFISGGYVEGRIMVVAQNGKIQRWQTKGAAVLAVDILSPDNPASPKKLIVDAGVAIPRDKRAVALATSDNAVRIVSLAIPPAPDIELRGDDYPPRLVSFSPGGKWLLSGGINSLRSWPCSDTGLPAASPDSVGESDTTYEKSWLSPDGSFAALFRKGMIELWRCPEDGPPRYLSTIISTAAEGYSADDKVCFSPDSKWVVIGLARNASRAEVRSTDPTSGKAPFEIRIGPSHAIFSPDSRWLMAESEKGETVIFDLMAPSGAPLHCLAESLLTYGYYSAWFSENGAWLFTIRAGGAPDQDEGPDAYLWRLDPKGGAPRKFEIRDFGNAAIGKVAFSPDGSCLAYAAEEPDRDSGLPPATTAVSLIRLGDAQDWLPKAISLAGHERIVDTLLFTPDGRWLFTARMGGLGDEAPPTSVRLWKLETAETAGVWPLPASGFNKALLSPDGKSMALAGVNGSVWFWQYDPATRRFERRGEIGGLSSLETYKSDCSILFSPDSRRLAISVADSTSNVDPTLTHIFLWFVPASGKKLLDPVHLLTQRQAFKGMKFSQDSSKLFTFTAESASRGSQTIDGAAIDAFELRTWDSRVVALPLYRSDDGRASGFHVAEKSQTLFVSGRTLHVLPMLDRRHAFSELGLRVGRNMTWEEWASSGLSGPYQKTFTDLPVHISVLNKLLDQFWSGVEISGGVQASQVVDWVTETDLPGGGNFAARGLAKQGKGDLALKAVALALKHFPNRPDYRATRGIARGLTGDLKGARDDLEYYVSHETRDELDPEAIDELEERKRWLSDLRAGSNPFANGYPKK